MTEEYMWQWLRQWPLYFLVKEMNLGRKDTATAAVLENRQRKPGGKYPWFCMLSHLLSKPVAGMVERQRKLSMWCGDVEIWLSQRIQKKKIPSTSKSSVKSQEKYINSPTLVEVIVQPPAFWTYLYGSSPHFPSQSSSSLTLISPSTASSHTL